MSEHKDWPPDAWSPILVEVGRIVFNWNTLEGTITRLLNVLAGGGDNLTILTAHIGNKTISDAVSTFANEFYDGEEREHLVHLLELFDRARRYRNYYIHSFNGLGVQFVQVDTKKGPVIAADMSAAIARLQGKSARKRLVEHSEEKRPESAKLVARMLKDANSYAARVSLHFKYPEKHALPEKISLPEKLKIPRQYIYDTDGR